MLTPVHSEVPRVTSASHTSLRNTFIKDFPFWQTRYDGLFQTKSVHVIYTRFQQQQQHMSSIIL